MFDLLSLFVSLVGIAVSVFPVTTSLLDRDLSRANAILGIRNELYPNCFGDGCPEEGEGNYDLLTMEAFLVN